jgi:uncharacterized alpha-E superfamily protein
LLEPLLEIADSSMTYRRRYLAQAHFPSVLDLLLADKGNPRSLVFQLDALVEHAANLPRSETSAAASPEQRRLAEAVARLDSGRVGELARTCANGEIGPLNDWLRDFALEFSALSDDLMHHYFSLTVARVS